MKRCRYIFRGMVAVLAVALAAASCADDWYDNGSREALELSVTDSITVDLRAQTISIGVTARQAAWTMTGSEGSEEWCTVEPASGQKGISKLTVTFAANDPEGDPREATLTFSSGGVEKAIVVTQLNGDIILPNENPDSGVNKMMHEELKTWYYNGEAREVAPDYNQSYDDFYINYLTHLNRNVFDKYTWVWSSSYNEDHVHSYIERNPLGTSLSTTPRLNYGMEFDLADFSGLLVGRVLYVEPGSPAARAGLERGSWFYKVNDVQMGNWESRREGFRYHYNVVIDSLVNPVAGESQKLSMLSFRTTPQAHLIDEGRTVTITPDHHPNNPILATQVINEKQVPALGQKETYTGYMMYNSFDPDYKSELEAAFNNFRNRPLGQNLSGFILDLRYNKSGTVEMAELMGNLLVGDAEGVAGKTFAEYRFDGGNTAVPAIKTVQFASHPNGIGVDTVFVLTSRHTAGASELLINALRGLDQEKEVKLIVIGETTRGLAAGMVKRTIDNLSDEWEYSAWMLAFRCFNGAGEGDYYYGLSPNGGEVNEWTGRENIKWSTSWGWKGQIGSTEDQMVKRAVDMIKGSELIPAAGVYNTSKHDQTGHPREWCFPTNMTMEINDGD